MPSKPPTAAEIRHQLTDTYARACVELKTAETAQLEARGLSDAATLAYGAALSRMLQARRALNHCLYTHAGLVRHPAADQATPSIEAGK